MTQILVRRSGPLEGTVPISGAKNSVLKLMAATTLAQGNYVLHNVPDIIDVDCMSDLLRSMGITVTRSGAHDLLIDRTADVVRDAPYELVERMRVCICVLGSLLARCVRDRVALASVFDFYRTESGMYY